MSTHLAIFVGDAIEKILKGKKTIDIRLSQSAAIPYRKVMSGDMILLKQSSGGVVGQAEVENILYFQNLDVSEITKIKYKYGSKIKMDEQFWLAHANAKYATLIFLIHPQRVISDLPYHKKDRRSWVIL
jgi:hypothetical protein